MKILLSGVATTLMQQLKNQTDHISAIFQEDAVLMSQTLMEGFENLQLENDSACTIGFAKNR